MGVFFGASGGLWGLLSLAVAHRGRVFRLFGLLLREFWASGGLVDCFPLILVRG